MSFLAVGIAGGVGVTQAVIGGISAHKNQKAIEKTPTPFYQPNKGIGDYYQEALNRYYTSPYASQMYQQAQQASNKFQGTSLGGLQDRRLALGGIGALQDQSNQSMQRAGMQAEQLRNQNFRTVGQAANMQAGDQRMQFQYNQLAPYQKRMSILGAKASAGNQMMNAGMQNAFGAVGSFGKINTFNKMFPSVSSGSGGYGGGNSNVGGNSDAISEGEDYANTIEGQAMGI